jgi:Tfp pilus assembly protein PilV
MSSRTKKINSSGGFTIMEVALAATVLALTLTGMIGVIESGSSMLDMSRKQTLAGQILHGEIDQLRLQNWSTLTGYTSANAVDFGVYGYGATTTLTAANDTLLAMYNTVYPNTTKIFTLTRTVSCIQPVQANNNSTSIHYSSAPLLLQVTYTITWTGVPTGRTHSRVATTYVGFNGLYQVFQRS